MILVHLLLGIILGKFFGNYFFFILGSVLPDLDHIFVVIKNKFWDLKKIVETMRYEKKFGIRYKTPLTHSLLALIILSFIVYLFNAQGALIFAIAYLLHLLIDWIDIDEKYYLYPFKVKFKGFLPIRSRFEYVLTAILLLLIIYLYIF